MPDFEALIRHQQLKQPTTNKRLKIVDKTETGHSVGSSLKGWQLSTYFLVGFLGALIGAGIILFLDINQLIPLNLLKM